IDVGDGIRTMERMVEAQGGDPSVVSDPSKLEVAKETVVIHADRDGFLRSVDALEVGLSGVVLGAGRTRADQKVDPLVGISVLRHPGSKVKAGDELAKVHVHKKSDADAVMARLRAALVIEDGPVTLRRLLIDRIAST
ncbi:MAG: thymidine phosphorylase, partial [Polyangiaceae bacterium]